MDTADLPLFPLATVLFPGGDLVLRIFEARYLAMVGECSRRGIGFGVCLILEGSEVGPPAMPAGVGCEALIRDFSSSDDGLLVLSVSGGRRFRVEHRRVREDGLVSGDVRWLETVEDTLVRPEHQLLSLLLRRIVERAGPGHDPEDESRFNEAAWVGWRLAEWLPLTPMQRLRLLEESDPHARLQQLVEVIPDYQSW